MVKRITKLGNKKCLELAFREVDIQILGGSQITTLETFGNVFGRFTCSICQISRGQYSCIHIQRSVPHFLHLSSHMATTVLGNTRITKCNEGNAATRWGRSRDDFHNMFADYLWAWACEPWRMYNWWNHLNYCDISQKIIYKASKCCYQLLFCLISIVLCSFYLFVVYLTMSVT